MPELPEVETIRKNLSQGDETVPSILGMEIRGAKLPWEGSLAEPNIPEFLARVQGRQIKEIGRRGKYFIFELGSKLGAEFFLVHLRMSGDLQVEPQDQPFHKHCRMALFLEDDWRLSFIDSRKFGRVWLVGDPQAVVGKLGPEPLEDSFRAEDLHRLLGKRKRQLKPLLMDQSFLAGLGNIYTDEALFKTRLHPQTRSDQVTAEQAERLWFHIRETLLEGIRNNGSSIDWVYRGGEHQNHFQVYQRAGEPCLVCGNEIERIQVGQRGTHFCPSCQPLGE